MVEVIGESKGGRVSFGRDSGSFEKFGDMGRVLYAAFFDRGFVWETPRCAV